jgi:hypothetical protein
LRRQVAGRGGGARGGGGGGGGARRLCSAWQREQLSERRTIERGASECRRGDGVGRLVVGGGAVERSGLAERRKCRGTKGSAQLGAIRHPGCAVVWTTDEVDERKQLREEASERRIAAGERIEGGSKFECKAMQGAESEFEQHIEQLGQKCHIDRRRCCENETNMSRKKKKNEKKSTQHQCVRFETELQRRRTIPFCECRAEQFEQRANKTRSSSGTVAVGTDCTRACSAGARSAAAMAVSSPCVSASLSDFSRRCCGVNATAVDESVAIDVAVVATVVVLVVVLLLLVVVVLLLVVVVLVVTAGVLSSSDCDSASAINKSVSSESSAEFCDDDMALP